MILLLGSPRSGTSWIGKIFDSHPDVIYRHEPDTILRDRVLPFLPELEELAPHLPEARRYLSALATVRHPKVAGSQPEFPKAYRSPVGTRLHRSLTLAAKVAENASSRLKLKFAPDIPDLLSGKGRSAPRLVIKSVSSLGRARLFAEARPDAQIVHIVRHPCAQIASRLRGMRLKVLEGGTYLKSIAATSQARRLGLKEATLASMSLSEQMAYQWLVQNQKVLDDMRGEQGYRFLNYDAFCRDPLQEAAGLFRELDLSWPEQTRSFIEASSKASGDHRYFGLFRESKSELEKWRHELEPEQIEQVRAIVQRDEVGRQFFPKELTSVAEAILDLASGDSRL
jgi:hypothetical protein